MNTKHSSTALALLAIAGLTITTTHAAEFTISQPGGTWNTIYGQGFSPSVGAMPDLGLGPGEPVTLESFTFYKSGLADSAADIRLAVLDAFYYDFNTPLTTGSASLVGLSDNTVASTAALAEFDPIAFTFTGLDLTNGSDYGAIFVNVGGGGEVTPVLVSALTGNYVEAEPGVFLPEPNYGGLDVFQYTTSNFINGGFFAAFDRAGDASFDAVFSAIPEPSCLALLALTAPLANAGRSRRS